MATTGARSSAQSGKWWYHLREPLTILFYRWSYLLFGYHLRWALVTCIGLLSVIAGLIVLPLVVSALRRIFPDAETRGWIYLFLIGCGGFTMLFAGHVEVYALLVLGFWSILLMAALYARGRCRIEWVGLVFGAVFGLHLSIVFWMPAVLALPWLLPPQGLSRREAAFESIRALMAMTAAPLVLGVTILFVGYGGDVTSVWAFFWGDKVMAVGTDGAMFRKLESYAQPTAYLDYLSYLVYLMPAFPAWLTYAAIAPVRTNEDADGRGMRQFFLLLLVPYLVYFITWRPDKHPNVDWDLFSGLVSPMVLVLGMRTVPQHDIDTERKTVLGWIVWWGLLYCAVQICYHSFIKIEDWPIPR